MKNFIFRGILVCMVIFTSYELGSYTLDTFNDNVGIQILATVLGLLLLVIVALIIVLIDLIVKDIFK